MNRNMSSRPTTTTTTTTTRTSMKLLLQFFSIYSCLLAFVIIQPSESTSIQAVPINVDQHDVDDVDSLPTLPTKAIVGNNHLSCPPNLWEPIQCHHQLFANDCYAILDGGFDPNEDCIPWIGNDDVVDGGDDYDGDGDGTTTRGTTTRGTTTRGTFYSRMEEEQEEEEGWACPDIFEPVLCDGIEYSNECYALMEGGYAPEECHEYEYQYEPPLNQPLEGDHDDPGYYVCPDEYDPVICNNQIFSNTCYALVDGGYDAIECEDYDYNDDTEDDGNAILCIDEWDPVDCGGHIFSNECYASREGWDVQDCTSVSSYYHYHYYDDNDNDYYDEQEPQEECKDNDTFVIQLTPTKERSCAWLAQKSESRIGNVCASVENVMEECALTCGLCL